MNESQGLDIGKVAAAVGEWKQMLKLILDIILDGLSGKNTAENDKVCLMTPN